MRRSAPRRWPTGSVKPRTAPACSLPTINHDFEFADLGGRRIGYDAVLKETDSRLVQFEIDCGWMIFAGHDPVEYFQKYPQRFPMIHVKDFLAKQSGEKDMRGAELGRGTVDYKPIFAAGT